jgi:hypothetical protein
MKSILISICLFCSLSVFSQVGISTTSPNAAAELEINSPGSNGGVLIPTMTDAEMRAIISPANGLFVFNTDKQKFMYNIGIAAAPNWTVLGELARMTGAQISAIVSPTQGDLRYNTTSNSVWYYDGTNWQELSNAATP